MRYIGRVGDVNPIEYEGGIVYRHKGVSCVEYYVPSPEDSQTQDIEVYEFEIEDHDWIEWHYVNKSCGCDYGPETFENLNERARILDAANALISAGFYYGMRNLDDYPLTLTPREAERRLRPAERALAKKGL